MTKMFTLETISSPCSQCLDIIDMSSQSLPRCQELDLGICDSRWGVMSRLNYTWIYFGFTPHPTITTRIIAFLVANSDKPSIATVTGWGVDPKHTSGPGKQHGLVDTTSVEVTSVSRMAANSSSGHLKARASASYLILHFTVQYLLCVKHVKRWCGSLVDKLNKFVGTLLLVTQSSGWSLHSLCDRHVILTFWLFHFNWM